MTGSPRLKVTKYFGGASVQSIEMDLEDSKNNLDYFWTSEGGASAVVSIEGQAVKSFDELASLAAKDKYKGAAFIEVGLFLSNDGHKSIWDKK